LSTGLTQGQTARLQRSASGANVVDQQHPAASHSVTIPALESISHILLPFRGIQFYLGKCGPGANQPIFAHWQTNLCAQRPGQQGGLVVAPLAQAAAMQGHRHDHAGGQGIPAPIDGHQASQGRCQAAEATVLERVHGLTQGGLKKGYRPNTVNGRGRLLAALTKKLARRGIATKRTERGQYKLDLPLTLAAERTACLTAAHATLRKEQCQQMSPDVSRYGQNLHESPASWLENA